MKLESGKNVAIDATAKLPCKKNLVNFVKNSITNRFEAEWKMHKLLLLLLWLVRVTYLYPKAFYTDILWKLTKLFVTYLKLRHPGPILQTYSA